MGNVDTLGFASIFLHFLELRTFRCILTQTNDSFWATLMSSFYFYVHIFISRRCFFATFQFNNHSLLTVLKPIMFDAVFILKILYFDITQKKPPENKKERRRLHSHVEFTQQKTKCCYFRRWEKKNATADINEKLDFLLRRFQLASLVPQHPKHVKLNSEYSTLLRNWYAR